MMQALVTNYYETAAMILFSIGFTMLLLQKNLIKKAIGLNLMDMSVYLFLAAKGYIAGGRAPIVDGRTAVEGFINPLPGGLVLTGIVVSVSVSAFLFSLIQRFHHYYKTLDLDGMLYEGQEETDGEAGCEHSIFQYIHHDGRGNRDAPSGGREPGQGSPHGFGGSRGSDVRPASGIYVGRYLFLLHDGPFSGALGQ